MGKSEPIFKPNKYEKRRDKMEKKSVKFGDFYMKEVVIWIHIYYNFENIRNSNSFFFLR